MRQSIKRVTLEKFLEILAHAQNAHRAKGEPIPYLTNDQKQAVEKCLTSPFNQAFGSYLYKGFICKAAFLFYSINKNHLIGNGNKRMSCLTLSYFCRINHYTLLIPEAEFEALALRVVVSDSANYESELKNIRKILKRYCKKI